MRNLSLCRHTAGLGLPLLTTLACAESGGDAAAGPSSTPLGPPEAAFAEDFAYVHAVRELPGGDVLVPDPLANALYRVDMNEGTRALVGRVGDRRSTGNRTASGRCPGTRRCWWIWATGGWCGWGRIWDSARPTPSPARQAKGDS